MRLNVFEIKEALGMAWDAIRMNKLRSFLTILGVFIGVTSVIGMASIIKGLDRSMARQIESLGSNVIYVSKHKPGIVIGNRSEEERNRKGITYDDAVAILERCPAVAAISPENHYYPFPSGNRVKYKNQSARRPDFLGVLPAYEQVNNSFVSEGRFITESDHQYRSLVTVIGQDVADALFGRLDPIGKEILVNNDKFLVIGVVEKRESILGQSQNNFVLIPYGTFAKIHPEEKELWLAVQAKSRADMPTATDQIRDLMRRRRGVPYDKPDNFAVFTQDDLLQVYNQVTFAIYMVMIVISSIGLLVGGVGVMNIMLVSVTERTREIGIRKAIGAKRNNILYQFLIEAMTLSGTGGILGILFGVLVSQFVAAVSPLPAAVSGFWVFLGFTVAVSVGLIFGIYPAYRAAKVDPIVSLRYE